jgi:hypothetical protein
MANDDDYSDLQQPGPGYADAQDPPSEYANKGSKAPAKPKTPAGKAPGPNGEVTILARYVWNPPISEKEEVQYLLDHKWYPWWADFVEITGLTNPPTPPGDFIAFMVMVAEYRPKSIKRLNFWTHANKTTIGMMGDVIPGNVMFTNWTDDTTIAGFAQQGMTFTSGQTTVTLDDVLARFADDAIFVLYGCDIASDPTSLLTALRDLLQVSVIGFKTENVYCPPSQTVGSSTFNRKGEKIGVMKSGFSCDKDSTRDWRSLISDPNAVKVAK